MELENSQWDKADADFDSWKSESKEIDSPFTDILKSAYLVFREKQKSWLSDLCNRSIEFIKEKESSKPKLVQGVINFFDEEPADTEMGDSEFIGSSSIERKLTVPDDFSEFLLPLDEPREKGDRKPKAKRRKNSQIIRGILLGDQQVFNNLYEFDYPKVERWITRNYGDDDAAKDIFQDGLLILIEKLQQREFDLTCSVSTYLFSICKNLWMNQYRKDKKTEKITDFGGNLKVDIAIPILDKTPDIYEDVSNAINSLGDPCKQLLECFYYKKLSWDEISDSLGYSNAASARNQKYKCLERIKKTVDYSTN